MAFPVIKLLFVGFKYASRPLNQVIRGMIKARGQQSIYRRFLVQCGQYAHIYEVKLNRYIQQEDKSDKQENPLQPEIKFYIKPLNKDAAFNKGVEYFSELFFFYGLLMALAAYEIRKAHLSAEA